MGLLFSALAPAHATSSPVLTLIRPNGGEVLTGGADDSILWDSSHDGDSAMFVRIWLSLDGGITPWYYVTGDEFRTGAANYSWRVPRYGNTTARMELCPVARDGSTACFFSRADFTISQQSPSFDLLSPMDGAKNVPPTLPLRFRFQGINASSISWTISPTIPFNQTWFGQELVLTHTTPFAECTTYNVTASARDPTGGLLGPYTWRFSTPSTCNPPFVIWTSPADGDVDVPVGAPVYVAFSEAMDTATMSVTFDPPRNPTLSWVNGSTAVRAQEFNTTQTSYRNVTMNPDPPGGNSTVEWFCRQVPPNSVSMDVLQWATSLTVSIGSPNPGDDNDLALFRDVNGNGVCDYGIDQFLGSSSGPTAYEMFTISSPAPGKYLAQVGPWGGTANRYDMDIMIIYIVPLESCRTYTVTVTGSDRGGQPLGPGGVGNPFRFMTTCQGAPHIVSTSPVDGENSVNLTAPVVVTFSEPMDPKSMLYTFSWSGYPPIPFNSSWSANDTVLTFTHVNPFPPCTVITADIDANDTDGNPLVPGPVPNPWSFTTDCGNPVILSTDPASGAIDVLRPASVTAMFSDAMNISSVSVAFDPPVANVNLVWPSPTTLIVDHDPFERCTTYSVAVNGTNQQGLPLVPGPVPNPWSFTTECGIAVLTLASPVGGESWTGGTSHPLRFTILNGESVDHTFLVVLSFRYGGNASGGAIGSMSLNVPARTSSTQSFPWLVPTIDATDVVANVTATDGNLTISDESGPFEIDSTSPQVLAVSPMGPRILLDPTVTVTFSEPMAIPPRDPLSVASPQGPPAWTTQWTAARDRIDAPLAGTVTCTTYDASIGVVASLSDDSDPGNPLAPLAWTFTTVCLPSVTLLAPNGGEDWTGGTVHTISWTLSDQDSPTLLADLAYSVDGGASFAPIATGLVVGVGPGSYDWAVPKVDSVQVVVRISVVDPEGNAASDASDARLEIDSTPPALFASFPMAGESGLKTTRPFWFVWTEPVDRASFEAAFSISPNPGGLVLSWSTLDPGGEMLTVAHAPLKSNTAYTVTFATTAKDSSDPGNPLAGAVVVRFNTQPPPAVNPPVAKAVGKNQVQVGELLTLDGRQSTGNILFYVWRIMDNQDRPVAVLAGAVATYTFRDNGRYAVTLIVTDANGLTDDDTLEIAVTSNPHSDLILAGSALFVAAALIASTEAGKLGLFSFFVFPLYVRRKRNEVLEHQTRGMILGYILVHPGDTYTDIRRNLMLSNGTLSYHLTVLEREGLVRSQSRGTRKLFYPMGVRVPEDGGGLHEVQVRMYRAIHEVPGLAVKDLAGVLGITSQHALYHLRALATQGYVRLERRGFYLRAFAAEGTSPPIHPEER